MGSRHMWQIRETTFMDNSDQFVLSISLHNTGSGRCAKTSDGFSFIRKKKKRIRIVKNQPEVVLVFGTLKVSRKSKSK